MKTPSENRKPDNPEPKRTFVWSVISCRSCLSHWAKSGEVGRGRRPRPTSPDFAPVAKATPVFYISSLAKPRGRYGSVISSSGSCPPHWVKPSSPSRWFCPVRKYKTTLILAIFLVPKSTVRTVLSFAKPAKSTVRTVLLPIPAEKYRTYGTRLAFSQRIWHFPQKNTGRTVLSAEFKKLADKIQNPAISRISRKCTVRTVFFCRKRILKQGVR